MSRLGRLLCAAVLALSVSGCGTIVNLGLEPKPIYETPRIYGGIRFTFKHLFTESPPFGAILVILDAPLSLVFDTLTLPYTIPMAVKYGDDDPADKLMKHRQ